MSTLRESIALEAQSGLAPWTPAEMPAPPVPRGMGWAGVVGPGVIVLGLSIGSGEFLLGPAAFVRHGLTLLWVTTVAVFLQTVFNMEVMRYTLATGEPAFTGFMRTRPSSSFWAWFYSILYFLQSGWPAWAGSAAGAIYFLFARRLASPADSAAVYAIGVGTFLAAVAVLMVGRRIERTLEILNWILIVCILGAFLVLAMMFVPGSTWLAAGGGFLGYDIATSRFNFLPEGTDFFLLGAFAAYSGAGGASNITLANWARDKGYGMGQVAGYIPAAIGGTRVNLAHTGFIFAPGAEAMMRWKGWWRIIRADQWGIFFIGAMLGMLLPTVLMAHAVALSGQQPTAATVPTFVADTLRPEYGSGMFYLLLLVGVLILFSTQLGIFEAMVRVVTDAAPASARLRGLIGGDPRRFYYPFMILLLVVIALVLHLAVPVTLVQFSANMSNLGALIYPFLLMYLNSKLPRAARPRPWHYVVLALNVLFFGFFFINFVADFLGDPLVTF